ncbi:hypothetical protein P030_06130 [Anaplasma phagocytophilum str. CRT35]|nr:hypothetical protein P030_06130 [Anaplasma phagocytophilum str. CRT35]
MEISAPKIDEKVCRTKLGKTGNTKSHGTYMIETEDRTLQNKNGTSLCGGHGSTYSTDASPGNASAQVLKDFVRVTMKGDGSKNWPTSTGTGSSSNDNAKAVAKDLVQELTPEEKTIVAGLLAKTIEGGEVVEIRAVSSTSSMVNFGHGYWGFIVIREPYHAELRSYFQMLGEV